MTWVPIAMVTAVGFASAGSYAKALSNRTHVYVVTWAFIALSAPWTALVLMRQGMPPVGDEFLRAALISVAVNMVGTTLHVKALILSPLSLTMPFLAFTPLFMLLPSWVVLGERPERRRARRYRADSRPAVTPCTSTRSAAASWRRSRR